MKPKNLEETKILQTALEAAIEKGAYDPIAIDVSERFGFADQFLILSAEVERAAQAVSDEIEDSLNSRGIKTIRREGRESGRWILLDFGDLVVHIFHKDERDFYDLERLWRDCPKINVEQALQGLLSDKDIR